MRYYTLTHLPSSRYELSSQGERLTVDLRAISSLPSIEDDTAFCSYSDRYGIFWLSGGGSILFNERYLAVVERGKQSRINPGKLSLFTGRSEGAREWLNPPSLARELFEELLLFNRGTPLRPTNDRFEQQIEEVYQNYSPVLGVRFIPLPLTEITPERSLLIQDETASRHFKLNFHINSSRDCNVIFLFKAECDLECLELLDGECLLYSPQRHRPIYLLDLESESLLKGREKSRLDRSLCTEHLLFAVDLLKADRSSSLKKKPSPTLIP